MRRKEGTTVEDPLSEFVRNGYGGLLAWIAGRAPPGLDVEGAVQEALLRAWMQPPTEIRSLDAWVRTVALNCLRTELRRRETELRALGRLGVVEDAPATDERIVEQLGWDGLLDQLPNGQREVVALHYLHDRSVDDVAAGLGVAPGTVKTHLHRARAKLGALLGAQRAPAREERRRMTIKDWFLGGSHPHEFEHEISEDERFEGKPVVIVRCVAEKPSGFGTLMQQCQPDEFIGSRTRFSGAVRSRNVEGWAGLWFRVDGGRPHNSLAFDNMQNRPIKGSTQWSRYDVVLDVSDEATLLAYGVLLAGGGEVAVSDFRIEKVGPEVPTTDSKHRLTRPSNLDFSE